MNVVFVEAPGPLDADLAAEIAKQSVHASRGIRALRWDSERRVARVEIEPGAPVPEVEEKLTRLLASMAQRYRAMPRKTLCTNARRDAAPLFEGVEAAMAERGFLRELGPGQVALSGPPLAFARALDARLSALARERFGAREEAYPALIPAALLHRSGYVGSFPQSISMVTHLTEDLDGIERFRRANTESSSFAIPDPGALAFPAACLSPAVCYHFYPSLEGARLAEPAVATAAGHCFRYESRNMRGLSRLWDFTMREVMFVGGEASVLALRKSLLEAATQLGVELDLDFTIETASDPFFSSDYAQKSYWQSRNDLKLEMKLSVPPIEGGGGRVVAAASFNLHEDHFGKTFEISGDDDRPAFSGCAAWGIERWVLAAFAQHGLTPQRWPEPFRSQVFG